MANDTVGNFNSIGHNENRSQKLEMRALGVPSTVDVCLARISLELAKKTRSLSMYNLGEGDVTITLKKRGKEYALSAQNITALRVGSTDQLKGKLTKARIKPGTLVITDSNASAQTVKDKDADGKLWQTSGPTGPVYPQQVGTVDYHGGIINFTFLVALTTNITAAFTHSDWTAFGSAITWDMVMGGGHRDIIIMPDRGDNWADSIRDEKEVGIFGKRKTSGDKATNCSLEVYYHGDVSKFKLPLQKGEIDGYPLHNA